MHHNSKFFGEMPDVHLERIISDWLLHANTIDQNEHADISAAAKRKRKLIAADFDQVECANNRIRNLQPNMSEDGSASNTSRFLRSLRNRPILVPTPPSSERSTGRRSPSPTHKLLALLSKADPPIKICQPGNAVTHPQHVADLRNPVTKDMGTRASPRVLRGVAKKPHSVPHSRLMEEGSPVRSGPR